MKQITQIFLEGESPTLISLNQNNFLCTFLCTFCAIFVHSLRYLFQPFSQ